MRKRRKEEEREGKRRKEEERGGKRRKEKERGRKRRKEEERGRKEGIVRCRVGEKEGLGEASIEDISNPLQDRV